MNRLTLKSRLVLAANETQAFRHVARDTFAASIPSTEAALLLQADGVMLERAGNGEAPDLVQQAAQAGVRG